MIPRRLALTLALALAALAPLAAQAQADKATLAMALRMDGFENVRLLYGGYNEWKARGGMDAFARASKKG